MVFFVRCIVLCCLFSAIFLENASAQSASTVESVGADKVTIDPAQAKRAYQTTCAACHADQPGVNRVGPSLAGIVGRKAGMSEKFAFSSAMKSADITWTVEALDMFLQDSGAFVPGNRMSLVFPAGVKDEEKRNKIIFYLESLSAN